MNWTEKSFRQSNDTCRISVLVPSYIRPDDLITTLSETTKQSYPYFEVVVIDDGTPDDTIRDVVARFPSVKYIRPPKNIGLIGARNLGIKSCSGEYILNLDDDSWLEDYDALNRIVEFMDNNPEVGVVALNIGLRDMGYSWPVDSAPFPVRWYVGCGNVYRRTVIEKVGDYIEEFYRQGEEMDRTMRVIDAGYRVVALPSVKVFHNQSPVNRNYSRHLAFEAANYLRRELIRAPMMLLPLGLSRAVLFALRHRKTMDIAHYREEVFGSRVPIVAFVRRRRKPVKISTYVHHLRLKNAGSHQNAPGKSEAL